MPNGVNKPVVPPEPEMWLAIRFDTPYQHVLMSIVAILKNTLPYMVDNVSVHLAFAEAGEDGSPVLHPGQEIEAR